MILVGLGLGLFSQPALPNSTIPPHEKAKGCIEGKVVSPDGKGLAGVSVNTHPVSSPKLTLANGTFKICFRRISYTQGTSIIIRKALPLGPYKITFFKVGYHAAPVHFVFKRSMFRLKTVQMKALKQSLCMPIQVSFSQGKKQGKERVCWPNGTLKIERQYHNGLLHGSFRFWMPNGQPYESATFVNGKHNGLYTRWDDTGKVIIKQNYQSQPQERPSAPPLMPHLLSTLPASKKRQLFKQMRTDQSSLKLNSQPWLAWIQAQENNEHQIRRFVLPKNQHPYTLRILAFGESKQKEMVDTAWIEDIRTGQFVWKMQYRKTQQADNDPRNRKIDTKITLPAGQYNVHFITDATHSPQQWIGAPASYSKRYGVTIYNTKSRGYALLAVKKKATVKKKAAVKKKATVKKK